MNKKTQNTNRFNIIDFMLIVALLACIIGITARTNLRESIVQSNDTATVTVMIRGLLKDSVKQLVVGDEYFDQRSGESIGYLQSFEAKPSKIHTPRLDGTIATTESTDRADVICKVKIEGLASDTGFHVDGIRYIGSGSSFIVRSKNLETEWLVVDIEVNGK